MIRLIVLLLILGIADLNAVSNLDNDDWEYKYRYDLDIDHETCTTAGLLRGYVKTSEMRLDNVEASFSPKMYSSWNFNWGAFGCSRSNQMTITKDTTASKGGSTEDILKGAGTGVGIAAAFLGPAVLIPGFGGLAAGIGALYTWLKDFNLQAGGTLVKGEIQMVRAYKDKLCAYSKDIDGGEEERLTKECKAKPSGKVMLNKNWHDEEIYIPCKNWKQQCRLVRAFCGYVKSAGLDFHLIKCLQMPFLPAQGKMHGWIISEEQPRLLYLNDTNNDFFNIKVVVAIGTILTRCADNSYMKKGEKCVGEDGKKYNGYKAGDEYDEIELVIPFVLDNEGQIEPHTESVSLNSKSYDMKFIFEGNNLCAQYKKNGNWIRLNCLHRPALQKPKNINITQTSFGTNGKIKMTADFAEDLTNTAYSGKKIEVAIDAGYSRLSNINKRELRTGQKKNEFKIGNAVFNFFRAQLIGGDIKKRRQCLIRNSSSSDIREKIVDVAESCDDGISIPKVNACDCGMEGIFKAGDPKCSGSSCNAIKANKCPNDERLEKDSTKDCNMSLVGYYDDPKGDYLCLNGWNDEARRSTYGGAEIEKSVGFIEVENKAGTFVIADEPGKIYIYDLNDEDRKTMNFLGGDIFSIWRKGYGLTYYQWREQYFKDNTGNTTYWMKPNDGYPRYINDQENVQLLSPYRHGLCISLPDQFKNP